MDILHIRISTLNKEKNPFFTNWQHFLSFMLFGIRLSIITIFWCIACYACLFHIIIDFQKLHLWWITLYSWLGGDICMVGWTLFSGWNLLLSNVIGVRFAVSKDKLFDGIVPFAMAFLAIRNVHTVIPILAAK